MPALVPVALISAVFTRSFPPTWTACFSAPVDSISILPDSAVRFLSQTMPWPVTVALRSPLIVRLPSWTKMNMSAVVSPSSALPSMVRFTPSARIRAPLGSCMAVMAGLFRLRVPVEGSYLALPPSSRISSLFWLLTCTPLTQTLYHSTVSPGMV